MERIKIKLKEGKTLFLPRSTVLMEEGKEYEVESTTFWRRRINEGDVAIVAAAPEKSSSSSSSARSNNKNSEKEKE